VCGTMKKKTFLCAKERERNAHAEEQILKTTDHEERICP
jgi:hypothetical protein